MEEKIKNEVLGVLFKETKVKCCECGKPAIGIGFDIDGKNYRVCKKHFNWYLKKFGDRIKSKSRPSGADNSN